MPPGSGAQRPCLAAGTTIFSTSQGGGVLVGWGAGGKGRVEGGEEEVGSGAAYRAALVPASVSRSETRGKI